MGVHRDAHCNDCAHGRNGGMGLYRRYTCRTLLTCLQLVDSVEFVREEGSINEEWFGLILLPIVSFSADGAINVMFFFRYLLRNYLGRPIPPSTVAKARAIDLSIQFILFWSPVLVLVGRSHLLSMV